MKISIRELDSPIRGIYYEKYRNLDLESGKSWFDKEVSIWAVQVKDDNGFDNMFLYDSNLEVITSVFNYLNVFMKESKNNTRSKALSGLKFLFSFAELFNVDILNMNQIQANQLDKFLEGTTRQGEITLELKTRRKNDSINEYLSVYRKFFVFLGISNHVLMSRRSGQFVKSTIGVMGHAKKERVEIYTTNLPSNKLASKKRIPKYISSEQYIQMLRVIEDSTQKSQKYNLRERVIIRLMYEHGLRLGEVLGLTLEDLPASFEIGNGAKTANIVLRNRVTDRSYQHAKGLYEPTTRDDYGSEEYTTQHYAWETVPISTHLLKEIYKYINQANEMVEISKIKTRNYLSSKADKVTDKKLPLGDNYYVFLNETQGTPLSSSGWNYILRELFVEVGLGLDKKKRAHNLSHRFRHGYAMAYIHHLKLTEKERDEQKGIHVLQKMLRHKSILSTMVYYNPDDKEISQMHMEHSEYLLSLYPELFS